MRNFNFQRTWGPIPNYPNVLKYKQESRDSLITIAGPCSVESEEQMMWCAKVLSGFETTYLRGGIYRAGTYPRVTGHPIAFSDDAFQWAISAKKKYGMKLVIEILDIRDIETLAPMVDVFQVGARHCQDYMLLYELSKLDKIVTLKRHFGNTMDEFLGAAEYLLRGRCKPILIERGGVSFVNHVRWDVSVSMIAAIKGITGLPVLIDASHGTGRRDLVEPVTLAGIAAGADGFLCEVHPDPERSMSDADQAISLDEYVQIKKKAEKMKGVL